MHSCTLPRPVRLIAALVALTTLLGALFVVPSQRADASRTGGTCAAAQFTDVRSGSGFAEAIRWAQCTGVVGGYKDGSFGTDRPITRNEAAAVLYRYAEAEHRAPTTSPFPDLPTTSGYFPAVSWLHGTGVVSGYTDGRWGGSDDILRPHFAKILYRMTDPAWTKPSRSAFTDVAPSNPLHEAISWMHVNGLTNGYANGTFGVGRSITRGELVAMLHRFDGTSTLRTSASADYGKPTIKAVANKTSAQFTHARRSSFYHVRADGIDYTKPVGVVFYMHGDYGSTRTSMLHNPTRADFRAIAAEANRRNMVLVAPNTPSTEPGGGATWWVEREINGDWFRAFANSYLAANPAIRTDMVYSMGYSGGAEFIALESLKDRPESWMRSGGALMIGGGTSYGGGFNSSSTFRAKTPMRWVVGTRDIAGATNPPTWSAMDAAKRGQAAFRSAGFKDTRLTTLSGVNHHGYNLAGQLSTFLNEQGRKRLR